MTSAVITSLLRAPAGSSLPDSVTFGSGSLWVEYGNGADATGASGSTTIVRYDTTGATLATYTLAGLSDGLKYDAATNTVWALQNNDGNSTLSLINAATGVVSPSLTYANTSASRGYDDVVFSGNKVFATYTNPVNAGDPVIVALSNGPTPFGSLATTPVLAFGATGTNLATGAVGQTLPLADPDSLKITPSGSLMFTSGDEGSITFVSHPGAAGQSQSFIHIQGAPTTGAGLDDVIAPTTANGTLYIADQKNNTVDLVTVTGLEAGDLIASVASLNNTVVEIDPMSGAVVQTLMTGLNGPHGLVFLQSNGTVANNGAVAANTVADDNFAEVSRLYQTAFNRAPDAAGLQYWTAQLAAGTQTVSQLVQSFANSAEFKAGLGAMSVSSEVTALYQNALGRTGDAPGTAYWTQVANTGGASGAANLLRGFSDSVEAQGFLAPKVVAAHTIAI